MEDGITFRRVPGHFNPMAVCSRCDRDATQTRMTRYCIHAIEHAPLLCDDCEC
jgi:hypothetical protein